MRVDVEEDDEERTKGEVWSADVGGRRGGGLGQDGHRPSGPSDKDWQCWDAVLCLIWGTRTCTALCYRVLAEALKWTKWSFSFSLCYHLHPALSTVMHSHTLTPCLQLILKTSRRGCWQHLTWRTALTFSWSCLEVIFGHLLLYWLLISYLYILFG